MATLTIRNVDEDLKVALRIQAARHGAIHGSGVTDLSAHVANRIPGQRAGKPTGESFSGSFW